MEIKSATICVTTACNLKCRYCMINGGMRQSEFADRSKLMKAINYLADNKIYFVSFTGGEPLLYPDIAGVIAYAVERGLIVSILTNGIRFSEGGMDRILNSVSGFTISLDGGGLKNDFSRGGFAHVQKAMELFKAKGVKFSINATISTLNIDEIDSIAQMAKEYGAGALRLDAVNAFGRAKCYPDEMLSAEDRARLKRKSIELTQKSNYRLNVMTSLYTGKEFELYRAGIPNIMAKHIFVDTDFGVSFFPPVSDGQYHFCELWQLGNVDLNTIKREIAELVGSMLTCGDQSVINAYEMLQRLYIEKRQKTHQY